MLASGFMTDPSNILIEEQTIVRSMIGTQYHTFRGKKIYAMRFLKYPPS